MNIAAGSHQKQNLQHIRHDLQTKMPKVKDYLLATPAHTSVQ
jgi:hypothetical protein